jgi:hypothetical protein
VACGDLGGGRDHGQDRRRQQDRRDLGRVGAEPEEHEEDRGEQVAQRADQRLGTLGDLAGQGDADQERAHGRGNLKFLGDPGDQQRQAEHHQQELFRIVVRDEAGDHPAVPQRDEQHAARRRERDGDGQAARGQGALSTKSTTPAG